MSDLWGDDEWDFNFRHHREGRRRPSPHHYRSNYATNNSLDPGFGASGLYRSRSQGHGPAPTINILNRVDQEGSPYPFPPQYVPVPYPTSRRASPRESPDRRGRSRLPDSLNLELEDMALEHRYNRSRPRTPSDAAAAVAAVRASELVEYQRAQREAELRTLSRERQHRLDEDRIRDKLKIERMEEDFKRERDEQRERDHEKQVLADHDRRLRDAADKKKEDERRAVDEWERRQREQKINDRRTVDEWERKQREEKENEKRTVNEWERKQREEKERLKLEEERLLEKVEKQKREEKERLKLEEERLLQKVEREKREAKEKEERMYREFKEKEREEKEKKEREWNEFLREQKEREEKKKKEEKEAEEKFQHEMRKRLENLGYSSQTIEIMVDEEKAKKFKTEVEKKEDTRVDVFRSPRAPVYPKVHRDYLAVETLKYYDLPWEYDRSDPDYIIILRDMDKRATDLLFEHTSRIRSGRLLIEAKKEKPKLAMYRRPSRSRAGSRVREIGVVRIG